MLDVMHDGASGVTDSQLNVRGQLAEQKRGEAEDAIASFEDATNVGAHCALQTDENRCMQWVSKQQPTPASDRQRQNLQRLHVGSPLCQAPPDDKRRAYAAYA
jgi:hypothetical protein